MPLESSKTLILFFLFLNLIVLYLFHHRNEYANLPEEIGANEMQYYAQQIVEQNYFCINLHIFYINGRKKWEIYPYNETSSKAFLRMTHHSIHHSKL